MEYGKLENMAENRAENVYFQADITSFKNT